MLCTFGLSVLYQVLSMPGRPCAWASRGHRCTQSYMLSDNNPVAWPAAFSCEQALHAIVCL